MKMNILPFTFLHGTLPNSIKYYKKKITKIYLFKNNYFINAVRYLSCIIPNIIMHTYMHLSLIYYNIQYHKIQFFTNG